MSKRRTEKLKEKSEKTNAPVEDDSSKVVAGQILEEKCPILKPKTIDEYQCSGNLEMDLQELSVIVGMRGVPVVIPRHVIIPTTDTGNIAPSQTEMETQLLSSKPSLLVVQESEDPLRVKGIRIRGWRVDEVVARVLYKILPSLTNLQNLHFWRARLTDKMVISLKNTTSLCSNLRTVVLEGNPLPEHGYHLLIAEDSLLSHLSLRNNRIGEEGARLIGSALSTARSANKNLISLNLAFNSIGDKGAAHIAQGLRLNRALLCLSLSHNKIGDAGATHLAKVLGPFDLTHEEIVERRRLLLDREQSQSWSGVAAEQSPVEQSLAAPSSTSLGSTVDKGTTKGSVKKRSGSTAKKDEGKQEKTKKSSDSKAARGKAGKSVAKDKNPSVCDSEDKSSVALNELESVEIAIPLLETSVQHRDGRVIILGNMALSSLNLSGNQISEQPLPLLLSSLQTQTEGAGLLRLCLQRNRIRSDCEHLVKIQELMALRDPLNKTNASQMDQEGQGA